MITSPWINSQPYAVLQAYAVRSAAADADEGHLGGVVSIASLIGGTIVLNDENQLYVNEDNYIVWEGMQNIRTSAYVNNATVQLAIEDATTDEVHESIEGIDGEYIDGSDGNYAFVLDQSYANLLVEGAYYTIVLSAVSGATQGERRIRRRAVRHEFAP